MDAGSVIERKGDTAERLAEELVAWAESVGRGDIPRNYVVIAKTTKPPIKRASNPTEGAERIFNLLRHDTGSIKILEAVKRKVRGKDKKHLDGMEGKVWSVLQDYPSDKWLDIVKNVLG